MKKFILICVVSILGFSACSKEETILPAKTTSTSDAEKLMNENPTSLEMQKPVSHLPLIEGEEKFVRCGSEIPSIKNPANLPQPGPPIVIIPEGEIR